jgi:uncharacterized protein
LIRVVLDTNLLVSALLFGGIPGQVYDAGRQKQFRFLTSADLVAELRRVLEYPKFAERFTRIAITSDEFATSYIYAAEVVQPIYVPFETVRYPKDIPVLACAVGGKAEYIVTGDDDLLILRHYENVSIVTPSEFLKTLSV